MCQIAFIKLMPSLKEFDNQLNYKFENMEKCKAEPIKKQMLVKFFPLLEYLATEQQSSKRSTQQPKQIPAKMAKRSVISSNSSNTLIKSATSPKPLPPTIPS